MYLKTKRHLQPIYSTYLPRFTTQMPPSRRRWVRLLGCLGLPMVLCSGCTLVWLMAYLLFPPAPTDIVILGMDARPGEGYLTRTDTVMLLNVTASQRDVTLLSIPRDVFIWVPDYGEQRINTINPLAEQDKPGSGPQLMAASLKESFGIGIDHHVRVDFAAFEELIDAVGGIDIEVPKLIIDYEYPTLDGGTITAQFDPGKEHMNGERALQYARTRHQDDDYQRAARQQQVIDALLKRLTSPAGIIHWPQAWHVIQQRVDMDLNAWDMLRLGPAIVLNWHGKEQRVLQRDDLIGMAAGYWRPDYDKLIPWIQDRFD